MPWNIAFKAHKNMTIKNLTPSYKFVSASRYLFAVCCAILCLSAASSALAAVTTLSWQPTPVDLNDLDHHLVYTWRLDNITVNPSTITSATLSFKNIQNWDTNANVLHLHLLDTAKFAGVKSFVDDPTNSAPVTDFTDDFISTRYHSDPNWLVANGTADTFLQDKSFSNTPTNYTYTFTGAQLTALQQYLANGRDIALGFDPDCHYFNDGITFTLNFTPVPEVANVIPIACLIATAVAFEVQRRRRAPVPAKI